MVGFDDAIAIAAVSSAATSVVTLIAALLKKASRPEGTVSVSIDGKKFAIDHVDPDDIDAVLAGVKKKVAEGGHRSLAEAEG